MRHMRLMTAVAAASLLASAPAFAQGKAKGAVNGPAGSTGSNASTHSQGPANASPNGIENSSPNSVLKTGTTTPAPTTDAPKASKSQGLQNASPNGIANASSKSVLARAAVPASTLPGLATGLTVQTTDGTAVGTISQVITGSDGMIRAVVVTTSTGETVTLGANTLSISGSMVTTTSTNIGG